MELQKLLSHLDAVTAHGPLDRQVERVVLDPADAGPGDLYVLLREAGPQARDAVAELDVAAVLTDVDCEVAEGTTLLVVQDARVALPQAAAAVAGRPGRRFPVVAITGSAGKTTVSLLLEVIAGTAGRRIGVVDARGRRQPATLPVGLDVPARPPRSPQVQGWLRQILDEGCNVAVLEASSRALQERSLDEAQVRVACFTGLGRDHLDFHGSPDLYLGAKLRLFGELLRPDGTAVIAAHDAHAGRFVEAARGRTVWRYGRARSSAEQARLEIAATDVVFSASGSSCQVITPRGDGELVLHLLGPHHLDDALAAIGCALAAGMPLARCLQALGNLPGLPRRMERVPDPHDTRTVYLDLARTPHALAAAIQAARGLQPRRLYLVCSHGADQDPSQRLELGQIASVGASQAWITTGEPAGPDPDAIVHDILLGVPGMAREDVSVVLDRREAIQAAVDQAGPEDIVLITGLGDELCHGSRGSTRALVEEALDASLPVLTSGLFEEL